MRALQEAGKLSYAAYLFHPIFAFLAIKAARAVGIPWIGPFLGVAMIGPIAFLIHRYIETPFLDLRPRLERSRASRIFLSVLQTGPILVGLVFLFPWRDLLAQFAQHPRLYGVAVAGVLGVLGAAAVRAGHGWALAGLDRVGGLARLVHRGLQRSSPVLNVVAGLALGAAALVVLTGGFRWTLGPVLLSVRRLDRPLQLLIAAVALRLLAAMAPPAPVPVASPALEGTSGAQS